MDLDLEDEGHRRRIFVTEFKEAAGVFPNGVIQYLIIDFCCKEPILGLSN
jgi:hypothetical protein